MHTQRLVSDKSGFHRCRSCPCTRRVLPAVVGLLASAGMQPSAWADDPGVDLVRKRTFLAFTFPTADLLHLSDRLEYYQVLMLQYSTHPTSPTSDGNFLAGIQYRQEVLNVNPGALLGVYYSCITTQNPINANEYSYPSSDYVSGDFRCDEPVNVNQYDRRPDDYGFYEPLLLVARQSWAPWGPGLFGRWPFYEFQMHGWVLPQSTYVCRPVIDIRNPAVINFVINELVYTLTVEAPNATAVSFDNGAMLENSYGHWPGWGEVLSPYRTTPPDADFFRYLDQIRAALRGYGKKVILNCSRFRQLAPHADVLYFENGIDQTKSPAAINGLLSDFRYAISQGAGITQRFQSPNVGRPITDFPAELTFFLASSMLVYEEGRFGIDPCIDNPDYFRFYHRYYLLPTWLMNPLETYREVQPYVYSRRFENGLVLLNANERRVVISDAQYATFGLGAYNAPHAINTKTGVIIVRNCAQVTTRAGCISEYQARPAPPIARGDLNCDSRVNPDDLSPFLLAMLNPTAYRVQYPYCDPLAADMDGDGDVDQADYDIFYYTIFHSGRPPTQGLPGDLNCDGYLDNFDIVPFVLAVLDSARYQVLYPNCDLTLADVNHDGSVSNFDVQPFINALLSQP